MNKMQEQLYEWHKKFGVVHHYVPNIPDGLTAVLRMKLIEEEMQELFEGIEQENMVEIADGLADLLYVVVGTAVSYGINVEPVFDEVHRSNMTKVWEDGTVHRNDIGKVIKPPTYSPADIKRVLKELGHVDDSN